jgi:dipeptidyl aminopeptidase/acylaminoacyl peptidase
MIFAPPHLLLLAAAAGSRLLVPEGPAVAASRGSAPAPAPTTDAGRAAGPAGAVEATLARFARLVGISTLDLSPDGRRVAWTQSINGEEGAVADLGAVRLLDLRDGATAPVAVSACPPGRARARAAVGARATGGPGAARAHDTGGCDEGEPVFSPDGSRLAFLSDGASRHQRQVYLRDLNDPKGRARQLTRLEGALSDPRWSPDGRSISVLVVEGDASAAGPLGPSAPDVGVMQEVIHERRLAVVDLSAGKVALVSPPDLFVYEYDWSPDGKSFVYTGAHGSGDDNWWVAELFTQKAAGGPATSIAKPTLQIASPRWSPDGSSIAYVGGLMSDEGLTGGDLFLVARGGGEPRNLTPGRKSSPSWFKWLGPDSILFAEWAAGESTVATLRLSDGETRVLHHAAEHLGSNRYALSLSVARDGAAAAFVRQDFGKAPEVWEGPLADLSRARQVSHLNDALAAPSGPARSIRWKMDGFDEQGWLLAPAGVEPGSKHPMIAVVHGGPAWALNPAFTELWGLLASRGYYVFLPNPRGSFGQGEAYTAANVNDFGGGDLRDILAGVDAAAAATPAIDPDRVGLYGWSYGGFMAMWAVTQTQRFRAAVAGAGIANWLSYYGENKIDQWMIPYFGASAYEKPAAYDRISPIRFIQKAKTPTLILQGERDAEVPAPQALEFWHGLKAMGVPTSLVIYPGEGHQFRKPESQRDMYLRLLGWFDRYLAP